MISLNQPLISTKFTYCIRNSESWNQSPTFDSRDIFLPDDRVDIQCAVVRVRFHTERQSEKE
jgi:hypothetical protein